jgi:hypothetical protein
MPTTTTTPRTIQSESIEPPEKAIIEHFNYIMNRFRDSVADFHGTSSITSDRPRRTFGMCSHVQDFLQGPRPAKFKVEELHIWSNAPSSVFCLACSRSCRKTERYMCGTCARPNDYTPGHYRVKDRACAIYLFSEQDIFLHVPLCRRCERIVVGYREAQAQPTRPPFVVDSPTPPRRTG